jgi:hypothetical protein
VNSIRYYDAAYSDSDGYIAAVYLRFDNRYDLYTRQVYSILDLLGDLGGLQGSLLGIGLLIVSFFTNRLFVSDMLQKIYQVRKYVMESEDDKESPLKKKHNSAKVAIDPLSTNRRLTDLNEGHDGKLQKQQFQEDHQASQHPNYEPSVVNLNKNNGPRDIIEELELFEKGGDPQNNK